MHKDVHPYKCSSCGGTFLENIELKRHIGSVHEDLKLCNKCDASFALIEDLAQHLKSVHEEAKAYLCQLCQVEYTYGVFKSRD